MNLGHLFIFANVAESGSFTSAARRLDMPVSTVSRQLAELEAQLGHRLIIRSTRSLRMTDTGIQVFELARQTVEIRDAVLDLASNKASTVSGKLAVSSPPGLSRMLLAPIVRVFQASFPEVALSLSISDRIVNPVTDSVDLAIRVGQSKDTALVSCKLFHFRHRLLVSREYAERNGLPDHPDKLASHRLLALGPAGVEASWALRRVDNAEVIVVPIAPVLSASDCDSLVSSVVAGAGICNLPSMVAADLEGQLVEVLPQWQLPLLDVSIVRSGRNHIGRPAREFIDTCAREAPRIFQASADSGAPGPERFTILQATPGSAPGGLMEAADRRRKIPGTTSNCTPGATVSGTGSRGSDFRAEA